MSDANCGCECCCCGNASHEDLPDKGFTHEQKMKLLQICFAGVVFVLLKLAEFWLKPLLSSTSSIVLGSQTVSMYFVVLAVLYLADYLFIGGDILIRAAKNICKGKVFDENFLMAVATLGAIALGLLSDGELDEAVAVMLFYKIGCWFEDYAVGKSRKNITDLMDIRPDHTNISVKGKIVEVDPSKCKVGTVVIVRPGEKIPIDGIVVEGSSTLNTSALTGESAPQMADVGSEVFSGCIVEDGLLNIKTTKPFAESTVSKILKLVESSSERKAHAENFISKFARIYTPIVCALACALAILPNVISIILGKQLEPMTWIYRALTFLVISCPCALVISIPLGFFAGIGCASKAGILIKGSSYLEALSKLSSVVFDKTGTLTKGEFSVVDVYVKDEDLINDVFKSSDLTLDGANKSFNTAQKELLALASVAESASSHPIAKSILKASCVNIDTNCAKNIREISAMGTSAELQDHIIKVGKAQFAGQNGEVQESQDEKRTVVFVSIDDKCVGKICIADDVKNSSKHAINSLKKLGIRRIVMLTGDNEQTASNVAKDLEIGEHYSSLLPEDKVNKVEEFEGAEKKENVAFVGDGINDAPVLMRSDVGIAMGALGSDAAIEAADVVLMDDDPDKIPLAIKISLRCMKIIHENIVFALGVKVACLILGAFGFVSMYIAIFADVGVMVLAVLNAMRCLRLNQ